jgi:hypothetical protein
MVGPTRRYVILVLADAIPLFNDVAWAGYQSPAADDLTVAIAGRSVAGCAGGAIRHGRLAGRSSIRSVVRHRGLAGHSSVWLQLLTRRAPCCAAGRAAELGGTTGGASSRALGEVPSWAAPPTRSTCYAAECLPAGVGC